jgi:short-subunit dehydrogenase
MERGYAVVTGASQGLGEAIALQLAGRGFGIIAIARNRDGLERVAEACGALNRGRTHVITADLADEQATHSAADAIAALRLPIEVLVNNAGYAVWGRFAEQPLDAHRGMLQVNMLAPVILTHRLLPVLQQPRSYILNVGSMAGYAAVSTLAGYSGSKAFVRLWSRGLRQDMRGTGTTVTCVCPGTVLTGFTARAGMQALDQLAKKFGSSPETVAKAAVKAMLAGRAEVVPGVMDSLTAQLMKLLPEALTEKVASGIYVKHLPRS